MVAIQEISARLGRTTGHGISGNLGRHYPKWLLQTIVGLLFLANTINIGADLSAMADAGRLLLGGPTFLYVAGFATICVVGIVFIRYDRYVLVLKWLTLSLFAYVAALLASNVAWSEALVGALVPQTYLEHRVLHDPCRDSRNDNLTLPFLLASITGSGRCSRGPSKKSAVEGASAGP
jgi:Mn2+/Fe2+ NRAMP family transporter